MAQARAAHRRGDEYTVVSLNTTVTEQALRAGEHRVSAADHRPVLAASRQLLAKVAQDALDVTASRRYVYDKARASGDLSARHEYNDAIEAAAEGRDPVEYFLYDIHQGYCDYYATSMAVMLRSLGIPARMVSGYAEGFYDDRNRRIPGHAAGRTHLGGGLFPWLRLDRVRADGRRNAVEPATRHRRTPPIRLRTTPTAAGESAPLEGRAGMKCLMSSSIRTPLARTSILAPASSTLADRMWWLWGYWRRSSWRSASRSSGARAYRRAHRLRSRSAPDPLRRLQRWGTRLGLSPAASFTPYETARRLGRAVPEGREPIDSITDSYVRIRFSGRQAPDGAGSATQGMEANCSPCSGALVESRRCGRRLAQDRKPVHASSTRNRSTNSSSAQRRRYKKRGRSHARSGRVRIYLARR